MKICVWPLALLESPCWKYNILDLSVLRLSNHWRWHVAARSKCKRELDAVWNGGSRIKCLHRPRKPKNYDGSVCGRISGVTLSFGAIFSDGYNTAVVVTLCDTSLETFIANAHLVLILQRSTIVIKADVGISRDHFRPLFSHLLVLTGKNYFI